MKAIKKKDDSDVIVKIVIIGDSGVGKTNVLLRFCDGDFKISYAATIGVDFKIKVINIEGCKIKLQIWDTAGQERYKNINQTYYKGAIGVILIYSITD
jgi:Ras-related protein Rab-8A